MQFDEAKRKVEIQPVRFYIGVTDYKWFRFLRERQPDEVNFWKPGGTTDFRAIEPGSLFLFKLHKPHHFIVGGGFFTGFSRLPLTMAWNDFGTKNGMPDYETFATAINNYRRTSTPPVNPHQIGCIILTAPFFLPDNQWIPAPASWSNSIVQGKRYDDTTPEGRAIWDQVAPFTFAPSSISVVSEKPTVERTTIMANTNAEYVTRPVLGAKYLRTARLGQGAFRALILEQYHRRCCITNENTLPVLQAAHIKPVAQHGTHSLRNGLLLRADLHILFDQGLIGVTPDYKVRISSHIREQFLNSKVYFAHDGKELHSLPDDPLLRPDPVLLDWHLQTQFKP